MMDLKAEALPTSLDWSQLSDVQKDILDWAMKRFAPVFHDRDVIRSWFVARRFVLFNTSNDPEPTWRLTFQVSEKVYRVICDYDPVEDKLSWWVGSIQFRPLKSPEVGAFVKAVQQVPAARVIKGKSKLN
jgi:hypothetical protein